MDSQHGHHYGSVRVVDPSLAAAGGVHEFPAIVRRVETGRTESGGFTMTGGEAPDGDGWASWRNRADVMLRTLLTTPAADRGE